MSPRIRTRVETVTRYQAVCEVAGCYWRSEVRTVKWAASQDAEHHRAEHRRQA